MRPLQRRIRAFTLVELLVVIGIIAALIGILLPVLSGVSSRGRDIKCQSNLRQIVQAMLNYATENKGVFPYGFIHNNVDKNNRWRAASGNQGFICWASQVGRYTVKGASGLNDFQSFPPLLQCPEASAAFPHYVGYVVNMIVSVSPRDELSYPGAEIPRAQTRPSQTTLMLKEGTALVWDTALEAGWHGQNIVGYLLGADIDGQRFWGGARTPQWRYWTDEDWFGQNTPAEGQQYSVKLGALYQNIDPKDDSSFPYQGNLRFRHNKNTACNIGFSDGSVRQFTIKLKADRRTPVSIDSHDVTRKYFMTKWPSGVPADPNYPP